MKTRNGVMVLLMFVVGCATTTPKNVYLPMETTKTIPFFRNGIPIAAGYTDSTVILTSIDPVGYFGGTTNVVAVWLLYKNNSNTPFLLKPLDHITFTYEEVGSGKSKVYTPLSPTKIVANVQNEKTMNLVMQAISGTLKTMSIQATTFTDDYGYSVQVNDLKEKRDAQSEKNIDAMTTTAVWYDIYKHSTYASVLKRNTLFAGQAVNGFVYFELENTSKFNDMKDESADKMAKYKYTLSVQTPDGVKNIVFTAIPGE